MVTTRTLSPLPTGESVHGYTLKNGRLCVEILDKGVTLRTLLVDDTDVLCGYDDTLGYLENEGYVGATIGRYANRIAGGQFSLNGILYDVGCNETGRPNHLHGGTKGFGQYVWEAEIIGDSAVRFRHVSPDGDEGYPGRLTVSVTVSVTADNALMLDYQAVSDKDTVINLTNHAYFNLNGFDGGSVDNTELTIRADFITPVSAELIPTGEQLPVTGTPFDFRTAKPIGRDIAADHVQLKIGGGYDHNFILSSHSADEPVVWAHSPKTGITMTCLTDQPGVQLYTGNFLNANAGKGGIPLYPRQGFCLETQHFPDSPNQPAFPTTLLKANELFHSVTAFRFDRS